VEEELEGKEETTNNEILQLKSTAIGQV